MNLKSILFAIVALCTLSSFTNISDQDMLAIGVTQEQLDEMKQDLLSGQS